MCPNHGELIHPCVARSSEDVNIFLLPLNTTAVFHPMDAGVIASLKWRFKRRLLEIRVHSLPVPLVPPSPTPHPAPPTPRPTSPTTSPVSLVAAASTAFPPADGSSRLLPGERAPVACPVG